MYLGLVFFTGIPYHKTGTSLITCASPFLRLSVLLPPQVSRYGNWTVDGRGMFFHTRTSAASYRTSHSQDYGYSCMPSWRGRTALHSFITRPSKLRSFYNVQCKIDWERRTGLEAVYSSSRLFTKEYWGKPCNISTNIGGFLEESRIRDLSKHEW
jgi:hypothetical protein